MCDEKEKNYNYRDGKEYRTIYINKVYHNWIIKGKKVHIWALCGCATMNIRIYDVCHHTNHIYMHGDGAMGISIPMVGLL